MATNLAIDNNLLNQAQQVAHLKTKKETVNLALREFVNRRKQLEIVDLFNQMDPDENYDYKESRKKQKGIDRNKVVTYEQDGETVTDSEEIKKIEKDIKNKLRSIVYKTTDFSEINNIESDNYIEMMENIKNKGYDSEVEYEIGLGCDDVIKLCESESIPVKLMNTILTSYNKLENNYNKA